jgi:ABC-2 type transport system permease protein
MKPYLALFRARFRVLLQYRAAAVAGFVTQLFFGLVKIMVLAAFYQNGTRAAPPMSLAHAITYTWLAQSFFHLLPYSANPDPEVRDMIRTGHVAYELVRPLDLHGLWWARALAARTAPTLVRSVPMFLVAMALLGMQRPPSVASALTFAVTIVGAAILTSAFTTIITASLMWTVSGTGIARIMPSLVAVGSGLVVPLPLFPDWAQPILSALPFHAMADLPFRLYLGDLPPSAAPRVLLEQIAWTLVMVAIGRVVVASGRRRLVVQGG